MEAGSLPPGHTPIIFFTISYMACSSSSNLRHRYFRKIRSPHRKAKPAQEQSSIKGSHRSNRSDLPGFHHGPGAAWGLWVIKCVLSTYYVGAQG